MTPKKKIKIMLDLVMIILLPILMAYSLIGERLHEWLGVAMFVLFIGHHILNAGWHKSLLKGRYTTWRLVNTVLDGLLFLDMLALMISGIILSRYIFDFPFSGGIALARTLHLLAAFWGFLLMSIHLGFHLKTIGSAVKNAGKANRSDRKLKNIWRLLIVAVSVYGIYAFIKRQIYLYLFLQIRFVFYDFSAPIIIFFLDYLAIMVLFACLGHLFTKFSRKN